jgi:hypothetical protein
MYGQALQIVSGTFFITPVAYILLGKTFKFTIFNDFPVSIIASLNPTPVITLPHLQRRDCWWDFHLNIVLKL